MLLTDFACVLGVTARSQAYMQALVRNHIKPSKCLVLSDGSEENAGKRNIPEFESGVFFDFHESIFETMESDRIPYEIVRSKDINSSDVKNAIQALSQSYLIYSGYGGAILKPHLFQLGKRWIHVHAGLLPRYRGSTTVYYSLLNENKMGATAIFLNERIDEGSIITSSEFVPPKQGTLIDYIYDPFIRSCVLVKALKEYIRDGQFSEMPQDADNTETYYIIHPVLKHIAILGLDSGDKNE